MKSLTSYFAHCRLVPLAPTCVVLASCGPSSSGVEAASPDAPVARAADETSFELTLARDVEWTHLNPARGDLAPSAGTLWGDRKGTGPTGFLLKPSDGFSSPPHIHNVSYRGIVIRGQIHNDDAGAEKTWMPAGSFWTQPQGQSHITAARGADTLAYIEIEQGPYLVLPQEQAFDSGERPVNVAPSNLVWLGAEELTWVHQPPGTAPGAGPQVATIWGSSGRHQLRGSLVRLPAGFEGELRSDGPDLRIIVVHGVPQLWVEDDQREQKLDAGSYFHSTGRWTHVISTVKETTLYVRSDGPFEVEVL